MASSGDNKITIINGDSISFAQGVTDAQRYSNKLVLLKSLLTSDIISVSNPGKTLRNTSGSTPSNSLLWELVYNGVGDLDAPTYSFYEYSTRINEVVFRIGANDVIVGSTTWAADIQQLFDIYEEYPRNKLSWVNIGLTDEVPEENIDAFNLIAKGICQSNNVKYIDLKSKQVEQGDYLENYTLDFLHPNDAGHTLDANWIFQLQQFVTINVTYTIL